MENFLSAVLGELMTRSINFILNKCSKPPALAVEENLQRTLLRAQVIIEEAMGRHITNQAMITQLGMLRDAMHQGYYTLDTFRYQPLSAEDGKDQAVNQFKLLSKVPSENDLYFSSQAAESLKQLQEALDRLSSMIADVNEFVMFLTSYPCLYRQPYNMHILLGNCMFGRQMETEHVIKFLLHTQPHSYGELEILPVVGPARVGKSTLIAHVCKDGRVNDYFSEIWWLDDHYFTDDELDFRKGCVVKQQNCVSMSNKGKRLLVVVELSRNLYEDAWNRFYVASKMSFPSGSKIIFTSRSNDIVKFGTTQALTLKHMSQDSYWYLFKTLTFGSMDPETNPRLVQLAIEIAKLHNRSIVSAYITSYLLRENFEIQFWRKVLVFWRGLIHKNITKFGEHPFELFHQNKPVKLGRMAAPYEDFMIFHPYHLSSQEKVPELRIQDFLYGSIKRYGNFEILGWRSPIPPYYSYTYTCEIQERSTIGAKRKRSMKSKSRVKFC